MKEKRRWKIFTYKGKEIFAYTIFGEGADEEEATNCTVGLREPLLS